MLSYFVPRLRFELSNLAFKTNTVACYVNGVWQSTTGHDWSINQLIPTHVRTCYPAVTGFDITRLISWICGADGIRTRIRKLIHSRSTIWSAAFTGYNHHIYFLYPLQCVSNVALQLGHTIVTWDPDWVIYKNVFGSKIEVKYFGKES